MPNPSFEIYDTCPDIPVTNYYSGWVSDWYLPVLNGSSDYFNSCDLSGNYSVPGNIWGYQTARTGIAYSGIGPSAVEYIGCKLNSPLVAGKSYCISFYVNLADSAALAIDAIGAALTVGLATGSNLYFLIPQVVNADGNFLTSKNEWTQIQGVFVANGGEDHLSIGNFRDNNNTNWLLVSNDTFGLSYYLIDDVSVIECSGIFYPNVFSPNYDGVNDVFSISAESLIEYNCSIYNRWGNMVSHFTNLESGWDGKNKAGVPCEEGVYFYLLIGKGYDQTEYESKGFVQLLR